MNSEIRSKIGQIRELAFKGTVPSDYRPKGASTHRDLFRTIMKIATAIEDELDAEYRERQAKAKVKAWDFHNLYLRRSNRSQFMKPRPLTRIVVIMMDGSMQWADCEQVCHDIFCFDCGDGTAQNVMFEGLGIDYFIVT